MEEINSDRRLKNDHKSSDDTKLKKETESLKGHKVDPAVHGEFKEISKHQMDKPQVIAVGMK
ncbi:peptidase, partial [Streptococcus agalactiae]